MKIEVFEQNEGLTGDREVWVRALSNTVVDWTDIKRSMSAEQLAVLAGAHEKAIRYYPHLVTPEEREEHDYSLEDWWVFPAKKEFG